jgi:hypothetical protein
MHTLKPLQSLDCRGFLVLIQLFPAKFPAKYYATGLFHRGRGRLLRSCDCYCIWGDTLEVAF